MGIKKAKTLIFAFINNIKQELFFRCNSHSFFLDPGAFTAPFTEEVKLGTPYTTNFVQYDTFDIWREHREKTLNTNAITHFTNCESGCGTGSLALDHITFKALDTLFATFNDPVVNSDIITCFELRMGGFIGQLFVNKCYCAHVF